MLKVFQNSPSQLPVDVDSLYRPRSTSPTLPMDTLELSPGKGVGPFRLGESLWGVIDMLRARKTEVPKIEVSWDPDNASRSAVTIHAGPVTLLFPSTRDQRLEHIQIGGLDTAALTVTYEGTVLFSRSHPLTRAGVARALGPAYAADGVARLTYPGVSFDLASSPGRGAENKDAVLALHVTPRKDGGLPDTLSEVSITPGRGATLSLPTGPVDVTLKKTTAQDLLLDLGPPLRKYWKEDDRLNRVWAQHTETTEQTSTPCFWNYFQYGIDFLIVDGTVTKLIVHSNIPGTPQFQQYARCPWVVQTDDGPLDITAPLSSFRAQLQSGVDKSAPVPSALHPSSDKKKKKSKLGSPPSDASRPLTPNPDVPSDAMLLDRSVEGGLDGVIGMSRSQLVGFDGLVLEVDEATGAVSSVQVWSE